MKLEGVADGPYTVGIRPEGFVIDPEGPLGCELLAVEVMGRDTSVVFDHSARLSPSLRAVIPSEERTHAGERSVRFSLKPSKVFLFDKSTGARVRFGGK